MPQCQEQCVLPTGQGGRRANHSETLVGPEGQHMNNAELSASLGGQRGRRGSPLSLWVRQGFLRHDRRHGASWRWPARVVEPSP